MPPEESPHVSCPACGTSVTGQEETCPKCNLAFGDNVKFECPFCGTKVFKGLRQCPGCHIDFEKVDASKFVRRIESTQRGSVDEAINELLGELHSFTREAPKAPAKRERYLICLNCASSLESETDRCPQCKADLSRARSIGCPKCRGWVTWEDATCPDCHKDLTVPFVPEKAKGTIEITKTKTRQLRYGGVPSAAERGSEVPSQCPFCGETIDRSYSECPHCGMAFEKPAMHAPPSAPAVPAAPQPKAGTGLREKSKRMSAAEPRPHITTPPPARSNVSRHGLSNGIGETNGLSFVNGRKSPDGKAFVNGTGISNGLRSSGKRPRGAKTISRMLTNWKFLAILVAIMIVIPTFVYISTTRGGSKYAIDGSFGDWAKTSKYSMMSVASSESVSVQDWSIASHDSELFVYARAQGNLMGGPELETLFVYVDSDDSASTGYTIDDLGADYLLQYDGWNGTVMAASLSRYASSSDLRDWSMWQDVSGAAGKVAGREFEGSSSIPTSLSPNAKAMLVAKDSEDSQSVSYPLGLTGGLLVVRQTGTTAIMDSGVAPQEANVLLLTVEFFCQGAEGNVQTVSPILENATPTSSIPSFTIKPGETRTMEIRANLVSSEPGSIVKASINAESVVSSFSTVDVIGSSVHAYVSSAPGKIVIDGAFGDWQGKIEQDSTGETKNPDLDINACGGANDTQNVYFYVGVEGEILAGAYAPAIHVKPSGGGGGGFVVPQRRTGEDETTIFIDSDRNMSTGAGMSLGSKLIGADEQILVKGSYGKITSVAQYHYDSSWKQVQNTVTAANDVSRLEISASRASIGGSADVDFIMQTTSWKGLEDQATSVMRPDPWTITSTGVDSRSPGDGTWNSGYTISLVSGESIVDMDIGDGAWVYAISDYGRIYQWQVGTSTSWSGNVTDPVNGTANIVGIAAYKSGQQHNAYTLASDGRFWYITNIGGTGKAWTYKGKVWSGITDFADLDVRAASGNLYAIRSAANSLVYWGSLPNFSPWHITSATGSASTQTHVVHVNEPKQINERILVLCENGDIMNSTNGGNSWNSIGNLPEPTGSNLTTSPYVGMEFDGSGYLWVITASGWCYMSSDTTTLSSFTFKGRSTTTSGITAITCPIPEFESILPALLCVGGLVVAFGRSRVSRRP